ncbi:MAG: HAD family phosphatase [Chlamydiia bacterium]|nr:HAD family phosphatase [Chlamydiia bacterium]
MCYFTDESCRLTARGTIALDIDGTITRRDHQIPEDVARFFEGLTREGWQFIFVTGRPLAFAMRTLPRLSFPYLLGVQNGADLFEMPSKKRIGRFYLSPSLVKTIERLYEGEEEDFIIYSGCDFGDMCYYRPDRFSREMRDYLKELERLADALWKPVKSFEEVEQKEFPLIKCMGSREMIERLDGKLQQVKGIKRAVIKDPISGTLYLILVTHEQANKGDATLTFMERYGLKRPLITGGDDNNDIPLLGVGDVKIAMEGAPDKVRQMATIVAPPGDQMGIIKGLKEGIEGIR